VAQCTGLRVSELLGLQWSDIDFGGLTMHVKRAVVNGRVGNVKTEYSKDLLPLAADVAVLLRDWRHEAPLSTEGWVFANPRTLKPYRGATVEKCYFRGIGRRLGIRLGWHTFRHTYRTWLDATGASIGVQQKLMRHAQVSTTMNIYGNALMQSKRDANSKVVDMALNGMPEAPSPSSI
jgi:integrase